MIPASTKLSNRWHGTIGNELTPSQLSPSSLFRMKLTVEKDPAVIKLSEPESEALASVFVALLGKPPSLD